MSRAYADELAVNGEELQHFSAAHPGRLEVLTDVGEYSMTREEFADECDINNIMKNYDPNSWLPKMGREPIYYDFVDMPDLQSAMHHMRDANEAFMRLPASVRKEFDHDAIAFVDFAQNPDNLGKMREWGLAAPEKLKDPPLEVRVVPDPVPKAAPGAPAPGAA